MEALLEKLEQQRAVLPAVLVAALVVGALVVGAPFYFRRAQALTETDYILLPEFVNTTGETVFDGPLKQALAVKLQESPFLNVVSEERIEQTLRLMGRAPDERVTPSLAREICQRQGVKAMLSGQIAPLGSHYVIALNAVNCQSGDSLASEQVEAAKKEEVLRVLGKAASDLRRKLGESLSSIRKFDVPIEQATTSSLEGLKAYTLAMRERARGAEVQAIPLLRRAIELDPKFASAYGMLGSAYGTLGQTELGLEYTKKAFELRDRVSEPERFYLISHYYNTVTGDLEKAIETLQLWKQTYPRDWIPWHNLAGIYNGVGMYERAIGEAQEALRLAPNQAYNYLHLAGAYFGLNRFDEAKAISEQGISKGSENPGVHELLYYIAAFQGDAAGMERQVEWAKGTPNESDMLATQAGAAVYFGKLQRARQFNQQSAAASQRRNLKEAAGATVAVETLTEAELGNSRLARERAAAALALAPRGFIAQMLAGEALAISGQSDQALALAADFSNRFPQNTLVDSVFVPLIRASVEVERGNSQAAIELLQSAKPYEYGVGFVSLYVRGKAYLRARAGREAAAEFQKVLDHRGAATHVGLWPVEYPLAQLGLARAHALAGDLAQSRKAYQDFFALWKDADPDIPVLQEAKAEYAKLN
jgi:tetratricopeptide (TPR) repeat protein